MRDDDVSSLAAEVGESCVLRVLGVRLECLVRAYLRLREWA